MLFIVTLGINHDNMGIPQVKCNVKKSIWFYSNYLKGNPMTDTYRYFHSKWYPSTLLENTFDR